MAKKLKNQEKLTQEIRKEKDLAINSLILHRGSLL